MHNLTFLNHASFYIESESSILVIDPWLEGRAFNHGWALLDQSTDNDRFLERLIEKNKKIFIWITHEHSDHFNVPLILKIKSQQLRVEFIYQSTKDRRVENFLEKNKFKVLSAADDKTIHLDEDMSINVWSFGSGDAFGLIQIGDKTILNVNDCNLSNVERINYVKNKISNFSKKLDYLFIQFGYANWIGNEEDLNLREQSACEKISRIVNCEEILSPEYIFPFASFCYFCHQENFYMNDMQNSPEKLRNSNQLEAIQKKLFFLKPYDDIRLDSHEPDRYRQISSQAEHHYNILFKSKKIEVFNDEKNVTFEDIDNKLNIYAGKTNRNFLFFPAILELCGLLERPRIHLTDIQEVVELSYLSDLKSCNKWDISMHSTNLDFVLSNEYGFDATHVNGRFRVSSPKSLNKFRKFFFFQDLMRNGLGMTNLLFSIITLIRLLVDKATRKRNKII